MLHLYTKLAACEHSIIAVTTYTTYITFGYKSGHGFQLCTMYYQERVHAAHAYRLTGVCLIKALHSTRVFMVNIYAIALPALMC